MEDDAVIKAALHQGLDLRDVLGRPVGTQADDDLAVLGVMTTVLAASSVAARAAVAARRGSASAARRLKR